MAKENAILNKIFAGHDAGYFTLPPALIGRRDAEGRVVAALRALDEQMRAVQPAAVRARIVAGLIEAAGEGDLPAGFGAELLKEQDKLRKLSADHAILSEAKAELIERTPWVAMRMADDIIARHLRPAMATVLEGVRSRADLAEQVPWSDTRALVRASEEVREFHELAVTAAGHYGAIRDAQHRVKDLTGSPSDEAFYTFGTLRNMPEIWPGRGTLSDRFRGSSPWPDDPGAYMAWLVTSEAEPWMPTGAECEAAQARHLSGMTVVRGLAVPNR